MVEEQHLTEKERGVARNIVIFGVDNASSSLTDNQNNNFYYQVKNQPKALMIPLVRQKKKIVLTLVKQRQNFFLSFYYNNVNSYLCVNKKEIYKFKAQDNRLV